MTGQWFTTYCKLGFKGGTFAYLPGIESWRTHAFDAMEEEGRITLTLPPFLRPGSLHSPTFRQMLCDPSVFYHILTLCSYLKCKTRSWWEKCASSYNPFFRVVQITILATAKIARNTTRFSPWNGDKTLSTT